MPKILLIEDNHEFSATLIGLLEQCQYKVTLAENVAEAKKAVTGDVFDLILLDLGLPDGSGFDLCSVLKRDPATRETPIIVVSGTCEIQSKVALLDSGADDYVAKPFQPEEFLARIRARLRSSYRQNAGPLINDTRAHRFSIRENGKTRDLNLTPFEYRLLAFFVASNSKPLTREQLIAECHGAEEGISERNVDLHICSLRKKIGKQYNFIRTVYSVGYVLQFEDPAKAI